MRVAIDELVAQFVAHVGNVELALLAAYLGIEDDMQQDIAQFLANLLVVVLHQGIAEFKRLFDGVGAQALVGLLAVPGAFGPQVVHHVEQSPERL